MKQSKSILKVQKRTRESLPRGIRAIIYSFLPLDKLIRAISKLSKADRKTLVNSEHVC
jgi:hypothetical protein